MNIKTLTKSFKHPIKAFKIIRGVIIQRYFSYLQDRMIRKENYIISIKSKFLENLEEIEYKVLTPRYRIKFEEKEKEFLKLLESSYIKEHPSFKIRWVTCPPPEEIPKLSWQREIYTCALKNIKFFGRSGGFSLNNKTFVESTSTLARLRSVHTVDNVFLKHKKMKGVYTSIMHYFGSYNHFHWLIDNLPRLYGILQIDEPEINIIIPETYNKLQLETLRILLDDRFKFIKIGNRDVWTLEKFYFSFFCAYDCSGYMPKKYIEFLRDKFIEAYDIDVKEKKSRFYLSREKDKWRHLLNEEQVIIILKKYNFKVIHPKDLSIKEQISLFSSAEILVAPHGSALANLIFADSCKVLEIYPPFEVKGHFFMLGKALGLDYYVLKGNKQQENNNFEVDLVEFEEKIKEIVAS